MCPPPAEGEQSNPFPFKDLDALVEAEGTNFASKTEPLVFAFLEKTGMVRFKESGRYRTYLRFMKIQTNKRAAARDETVPRKTLSRSPQAKARGLQSLPRPRPRRFRQGQRVPHVHDGSHVRVSGVDGPG